MKIVDFREKTEALETVRKPPFRELSTNCENQLAAFFCPRETEGPYGHGQIHLGLPCWILSILDAPSALLQEEHYLSGPVSGDGHSAERRFAGCVHSKRDWRGEKPCVLRFFLVSFVLLYEAPSGCAEFPRLTLTSGQSAHYTSTNTTVAVFTVHTVSIGTVYKESYMKNNINMINL